MNTILLPMRKSIGNKTFVIPFACSEVKSIRLELSRLDRTESENKVLDSVWDRITLALRERGFEVVTVNFNSMTITAVEK